MSDFIITRPFDVTPSNMTTNIPTSAPAAYNAGTTYADGDLVSVFDGTKATVYESLSAGNTGNTPASSPTFWKPLGTMYANWNSGTAYTAGQYVVYNNWRYLALQNGTNKNPEAQPEFWKRSGGANFWAAFDDSTGTQTLWADTISYSINTIGTINSIGLLNLDAASVNVTIIDTGVEVFNKDFDLVDNSMITDWFAYFFEPVVRISDFLVPNLPNAVNPIVNITFSGTGEIGVGHIVVGQQVVLGRTLYGASIGITDYSQVVQDEFGSPPYIVQRSFNKRGKFTVVVQPQSTDFVFNTLAKYRGTAVLIVAAANYSSTIYFGLLQEWAEEFANPAQTILTVEARGLQ